MCNLSDLADAIACPRRRHALACLAKHAQMTLADLADEIAVKEWEQRIDSIPAEAVLDIYFALYYRHVPRLADAELVDYDQERDLVVLTDRGGRVKIPGPHTTPG